MQHIANAAAQPRFARHSPKEAVRAALALRSEAAVALDEEHALAELFCEHNLKPIEKAEQPQDWPAPFGDFLRLVVQGKDRGDRLNRFRRFLAYNILLNDWRERDRVVRANLKSELGREPLETEVIASAPELAGDATVESLLSVAFFDDRVERSLKQYQEQLFTKVTWENLAWQFWRWNKVQTSEGRSARAKKNKLKK